MRTALPLCALALTSALALACGDDGGQAKDAVDIVDDTAVADTVAEDSATDDTAGGDTALGDTALGDTALGDTALGDTALGDTALGDTAASDTGEDTVPNDLGFTIRYPGTHDVTCQAFIPGEPDEEVAVPDADWLCTFAYGGDSGYVYVRANATDCQVIMSTMPIFGDCAGWIALDGVVSPVTDAGYDWGGNHHNDSLDFTWDGKRFTYDHSSFGFGWRKCQPMDCLVVRDGDGALIEDGCTKDRTLPAVCRQIASDGTWGSFVDTFAPCAGDPNYR